MLVESSRRSGAEGVKQQVSPRTRGRVVAMILAREARRGSKAIYEAVIAVKNQLGKPLVWRRAIGALNRFSWIVVFEKPHLFF